MNSSNIIIGPGYLTRNSANFRFGDGGIKVKFIKKFREVSAEEFGRFDSAQTDRWLEISGKLWSGFENLGELFPATMLTPAIGSKLFGATDVPATLNGQDGSRIVPKRTMFTEFTNLELSTDKELFSADVKLLCLIASGSTLTPYKLTVSGGDCRPVLNITPIAANNVRLDWTTAAAGYGLEKTNAVGSGAAVWPPVPGAPAVINSRFVTTNSTAGGREFYRLHKP